MVNVFLSQTTCVLNEGALEMAVVIMQTQGDLTRPDTISMVRSQLKAESDLTLLVDQEKKRSVITLTLTSVEVLEVNSKCSSGQQSVDMSCGERF